MRVSPAAFCPVSARSASTCRPAMTRNPIASYPLLILQDGQNLFDPTTSFIPGKTWRVAESADEAIAAGRSRAAGDRRCRECRGAAHRRIHADPRHEAGRRRGRPVCPAGHARTAALPACTVPLACGTGTYRDRRLVAGWPGLALDGPRASRDLRPPRGVCRRRSGGITATSSPI